MESNSPPPREEKHVKKFRNSHDWDFGAGVKAGGVGEQLHLACSQLNYQSHFHIKPPPRRENQFAPNNSSRDRETGTLNIMRFIVMAAEGEFRLRDTDRTILFCLSVPGGCSGLSRRTRQTKRMMSLSISVCFFFLFWGVGEGAGG